MQQGLVLTVPVSVRVQGPQAVMGKLKPEPCHFMGVGSVRLHRVLNLEGLRAWFNVL